MYKAAWAIGLLVVAPRRRLANAAVCSQFVCPPGFAAKVGGSSRACAGATCDITLDLDTCCDQLCSTFLCATPSVLKPNASCVGSCDSQLDQKTCCDQIVPLDAGGQALRAAAASDVQQIAGLSAVKAPLIAGDDSATQALHFAAFQGRPQHVKDLLQGQAVVDARDAIGWTPLHIAAGRGHADVVELLLKGRANPLAKSPQGQQALEIALEIAGPQSTSQERPQGHVAALLARAERDFLDELAMHVQKNPEL